MTSASRRGPDVGIETVSELLQLGEHRAGAPRTAQLGVIGWRGRSRFVLPLGWPAALTASCLAYQGLRIRRTRLMRRGVRAALRVPGGRPVLERRVTADVGDGSLIHHVTSLVGVDDVGIAIGLGGTNELWRPTLQVFAPDGRPLAFVKVAGTPLAAHLVAAEAAALRLWAGKTEPELVVPGFISLSRWRDCDVLTVAPLPLDVRGVERADIGADAVRALDPPVADGPIASSTWWAMRRALPLEQRASSVMDLVEAAHGSVEHRWARWHGDWVPWNLATTGGRLVAWDWEYSEPGAPVGLDEVHTHYQVARYHRLTSVAEALAAARASTTSRWLTDVHMAMLVTRAAQLAAINGRPVADHDEVIDAVDVALRTRERLLRPTHG